MSSLGTTDDFTIMRLRVKGSKLDPLAVRPRVQQLISEIRLYPLLPESASVFIRKLEDPSPGLLRLEAIDSRATQAWRRSFNTRFKELVTTAARPAHGPVSSSAESVVFLDYSELLACLTADWWNGVVGARWWWHSFLKRGDIEQVIKRLWLERIEYVPAALQQLAKMHVLVEFVGGLSERETHHLIQRLVEKFALPLIRPVLERFSQQPVEARLQKSVLSSVLSVSQAEVRKLAPWKRFVPESNSDRLRPVQQLFVGVALMIKRAPAEVRTQTFAREVERWWSIEALDLRTQVETKERKESEPIESPKASESETQILRIKTDRDVATGEIEFPRIGIEKEEIIQKGVAGGVEVERIDEGVSVVPEVALGEELRGEVSVESDVSREVEIEPAFASALVDEVEESLTIETELGGFFYLVNLAIFLEIYSDFTSPVETFTELNIWEFVALVGDELNEHEDADDPIWILLEELSPQRRKGAKEDLRLPGRSDLCAFAPLRGRIWVLHQMPYIRARLRRALGTDDLSKIVLRHHARVTVTATHLDVFFSLAELPIEIRLAGLDRDPGWVPAAGRFIAFHFE